MIISSLGAVETPLVKVCGLTRAEDVVLAAELGAWAVGFVFAPSPRRVTVEEVRPLVAAARELAGRSPLAVGVFGDTTLEAIVAVVEAAELDAVQLHGEEPGASAVRAALGERARKVLILQAIPVPATGAVDADVRAAVATARGAADFLLFDTRSNGRFGGTGTPFPWAVAPEVAGEGPFLVAGGIAPHNVKQALAETGAWGVDVSSGVERSPGIKDDKLLRALFAAVLVEGRRT
jgi:phosphoribosylanthranilate isomerase